MKKEYSMEIGDVFKVTGDFASQCKVEDGSTFCIKKITSVEVRASRVENGRPKKGRPRKFPFQTVSAILGESNVSKTSETEELVGAQEEFESADVRAERNKEAIRRSMEKVSEGADKVSSQDW
jgi:hypothetical protein